MGAALGFGPIKDDDELLDRLGSRCADDEDGMEALLVSWTASIDADEQESARGVGPLGLRPVPGLGGSGSGGSGGGDDSSVRVVKVRRARAVAVLGALVLTVSGGGVAAAINQGDLVPLRTALQKAGVPVGAVAMPTTSSSPEMPAEADPASVEALEEIVDRARNAARSGEVEKAKGMLEAVRSVGAKGAAANEVTAAAERLEAWIDQSPSVVADSGPTKDPLAIAIATSAVSSTATAASSPTAAGTTGSGTATKKPESATTGTGDGTGVATTAPVPAETPVSGGTTGQPDRGTTTPSEAPTPTNVGSASGEQTAGTAPGTPAPVKTAPTSQSAPAPTTDGTAPDPTRSAGGDTGAAKPETVAPTAKPTAETTTPRAAAADGDD